MAIRVIILFFILGLGGCGTPLMQQPISEAGRSQPYTNQRSVTLDQTSHMVGHLDHDKNIIYLQNFGGGGVGLGLLLGPLGVAANISMINERTNTDIKLLLDKIKIDPAKVFVDASRQVDFDITSSATSGAPNISPYIYVVKGNDQKLYISAAILIEFEAKDEKKWIGKYFYQLPLKYSVEEISKGEPSVTMNIENHLAKGYMELIKFHQSERLENLATEKKVRVKSDFVTPRIIMEMYGNQIAETEDRVWVRYPFAVYSLLKLDATFVLVD